MPEYAPVMAFQVFNFFMSIGLQISLRSFQQAKVCAGFYMLRGQVRQLKDTKRVSISRQ